MGSFMGHAAPGTFFLVFGLWWAFASLRRYLVCKRDGTQFESTAIFGLSVYPNQNPQKSSKRGCRARTASLPMEAVVKILFCIMGLTIEIGGHMPPPLPTRIVQHSTMYGFFLVAGLLDAAWGMGIQMPNGIQYGSMALALAIEGLLFASHVHGRETLDVHIHMLLVKVIAVTVAVLLLEARFRQCPLLPVSRGFLLMLQGTWFWAVAVILYKHGEGHSTWDLDSPHSVTMATIFFCWHCAVIFVVLLVMNLVMSCYYLREPGIVRPLGSRQAKLSPSARTMQSGGEFKSHTDYSILSATYSDDGGSMEGDNHKELCITVPEEIEYLEP